jgi:GNAT superfamily N-acetyltransferase
MEVDVALLDSRTAWQISAEGSAFPRAGLPRPPCTIMSLRPEHEVTFRDLLLGLDLTSRVSRFSGALGDKGILRHVRQASREAAWIAGLFVNDELCGVAELYESLDPRDVEAAFAVASRWRRMGFGTALLFAAIDWARRTGRVRLRMIFARNNWAMRRLASKAAPQLELELDELIANVIVGDRRAPSLWRAD